MTHPTNIWCSRRTASNNSSWVGRGGEAGARSPRGVRLRSVKQWLAALGAGFLVAACGTPAPPVSTTPASTPTPSPLATTAQPLGASTPVEAVQALMPTGGVTICRPSSGPRFAQAAGCPVTTRLEQRLQSNPLSGPGGGADPVCRCQNIAPATLAGGGAAGGTANVKATFQFQPPLVIQFVVVQQGQGSGWLVDDSLCADMTGSIYDTPVKHCTP